MKKSFFLSCLFAFLPLLACIQVLAVSTSTRDLGNNVIPYNADFSVTLYLDSPLNTNPFSLNLKYGLWSGTYADIAVSINNNYLGQFRTTSGYINPGPEFSTFTATGFLLDGANKIDFHVVNFYNPRLYYVDYVIGQVSVAYDSGATAATPEKLVGNQWIARYNGPGNADDEAAAIVVDASGNVYVTGYSTGTGTSLEYSTIKYDANGQQLWVARYNGPGDGDDRPSALAVDASGNVYVTGSSSGLTTDMDYATVKYNAYGNQLWVARYNGLGNGTDAALALAVDAADNIYVTGSSQLLPGNLATEYATIKYGPDGNVLWLARYSGTPPASDQSRPAALAVDTAGNAYLTGSSRASYPAADYTSDYVTIKYDATGNEMWVAIYNGPENADDQAKALAVDLSGSVYVTGNSYKLGANVQYATIKYDHSGNALWVARYNKPNCDSYAVALAVDAGGNIYVTGGSVELDSPIYTIFASTIKYDASGNQLWVTHYGSSETPRNNVTALGLDAAGNVYVSGSSLGSRTGAQDYTIIKYDPGGNELWVTGYNGPNNSIDQAFALATDASGNVYISGHSDFDFTTIRLIQDSGGSDEGNDSTSGDSGNSGGSGGVSCFINAIAADICH